MRKAILIIVPILVLIPVIILFAVSSTPALELSTPVTTIGEATPIAVHVSDKSGVRRIDAFIEQGGSRYNVWEMSRPSRATEGTWNFVAGSRTTPQLTDGKARLVIEATSYSLLRRTTRVQREVSVATKPPVVSASSDTHYLYLGMADMTTFNVSGSWTEAGVRVGDQKFRAWPVPGGKPGFFSLFAFAWNMPADTIPMVYASNGAGNDVTSPLAFQFPKKEQPKYSVRNLPIDDRFIQKVVGELDPNGSGDLMSRFLKINNDMRRANNKALADLRFKTADRFLWSKPFIRQPGSSTEATFADTRNYIYQGKKIDQQTHLGYDLAVTQNVGVQASNDGRVVFAAPLGIYGNCIVVDHGYGLQSIYAHLSRIDVREGDTVKQGQVMGLSGMTGMAGGDHIHFGMQLDGVQVDPKNWWDAHWIQDHIVRRVELPGFGG